MPSSRARALTTSARPRSSASSRSATASARGRPADWAGLLLARTDRPELVDRLAKSGQDRFDLLLKAARPLGFELHLVPERRKFLDELDQADGGFRLVEGGFHRLQPFGFVAGPVQPIAEEFEQGLVGEGVVHEDFARASRTARGA